MGKLFNNKKTKHIDTIIVKENIVLFIQDDTLFPSKITSIDMNEVETKKLIRKLQYNLKALKSSKK